MEIIGRIIQTLPVKSGVSKNTGNTWMTAGYVLQTEGGQYDRKLMFEVFGQENISRLGIKDGKLYKVFFNLESREYNGNWYTQVRAYDAREFVAGDDGATNTNKSEEPTKEDDLPY